MFDQARGFSKRIAVIGGGISGLSAAYHLSPNHDVTIFEAEPRLGGHARTVLAGKSGTQAVDTGFIVFNYVTYPHLTALFRDLNVPVEKSEMSFAVSIDEGRVEFGLGSLQGILAQKRNILRPAYYKMIADILKFGREAEAAALSDDQTIGELIADMGLGQWFRDHYLMPMCGAIWSTPTDRVDAMPAKSLVEFFRNHALLAGGGQHQWWTVTGGSIEYVRRLELALKLRGCDLRFGSPVQQVRRSAGSVQIVGEGGVAEDFDDVILACHSDQALSILGEGATDVERDALSSITYQPNKAVLHCDDRQMPKSKKCWSSWNYRSNDGAIGVTYWMNRLQNIPEGDPLFLTLNPSTEIDPAKIYDEVNFAHPVFDGPALKAQKTLRSIQGHNRTWFAGAYNRNGFHEDGIASAMRVVRKLNDVERLKDTDDAHCGQSSENAILVDMREFD